MNSVALTVSPVRSQNEDAFGNAQMPAPWLIPSALFLSDRVNFTVNNETMSWVFPFAVTYALVNESHIYSYSTNGLSISFVFREMENGQYKLAINGTTSRDRYYNVALNALHGVVNGTNRQIIFNNIFVFDWTDAPSFITVSALTDTRLTLRVYLPKGNFYIDPTFGYTSALSGGFTIENYYRGLYIQFTGGTGYKADSITAWLRYTTTSSTWSSFCALYDASGNLVAQTEVINRTYTTSFAEYTYAFASPPSLTNNAYYYIVITGNSLSGTLQIAGNNSGMTGYTLAYKTETYDIYADATETFSTLSSQAVSIYCTYSSAGTAYQVSVSANFDILVAKATQTDYARSASGNIDLLATKATQTDYARSASGNIELFASKATQADYARLVYGNADILATKATQTDYARHFDEAVNVLAEGIAILGEMVNIFIEFIYDSTIAKLFEYQNNTYIANGTIIEQPTGANITIFASPINGSLYEFAYYNTSGVLSYDNPYNVVWDSNKTVSANMLALVSQVPAATTLIIQLAIMLVVMGLAILFYILKMPLFVLVVAIFGLVINLISLGYSIPFTPYLQGMFSIVELVLIIYSVNRVRS